MSFNVVLFPIKNSHVPTSKVVVYLQNMNYFSITPFLTPPLTYISDNENGTQTVVYESALMTKLLVWRSGKHIGSCSTKMVYVIPDSSGTGDSVWAFKPCTYVTSHPDHHSLTMGKTQWITVMVMATASEKSGVLGSNKPNDQDGWYILATLGNIPSDGGDDLTGDCHHHFLSSSKIQIGNILVTVYRGCTGKLPLNECHCHDEMRVPCNNQVCPKFAVLGNSG